jgi:hypothetical protein
VAILRLYPLLISATIVVGRYKYSHIIKQTPQASVLQGGCVEFSYSTLSPLSSTSCILRSQQTIFIYLDALSASVGC